MDMSHAIKSVLLGVTVGDALGVPVEFLSRDEIRSKPVTGMVGYGTHNMPPGTFSDDSSLTFCLAEALTEEFSLERIARNFILWCHEKFWTATGSVFDIGNTTSLAISRLNRGVQPELAGGFDSFENGNGSLMRIAPLLFYIHDKPIEERYTITKQVSSITHGHIRSVIACFIYLEFARQLFYGDEKFAAYIKMQQVVNEYLDTTQINPVEIALFGRVLKADIHICEEIDIRSSGYVLHTLEASIWCLLKTDGFDEAVLKAVNLGEDTDTTGAVTGALAGLIYGDKTINKEWLDTLARRADIEALATRLAAKCNK